MDFFFKKVIFKDSMLNIIGSLILTIATQGLAYPLLAKYFSIHEYGTLLTLMGIINTIGVTLGNSLNNTRLLMQSTYNKKGLTGDFNFIFVCILIVGIVLSGLSSIIFLKKFNITIIGCVLITTLIIFRSFYSVGYRLLINYRRMLISNIYGAIGYIIGIIVSIFTNTWVFTFIFGELLASLYIIRTSHVVNEKFNLTPLFKISLNRYLLIMGAAIITNFMMYMDRFFIFPLLGAEQVSIFTVASFLGKTAGILFNPISAVLLTYYVKENRLTLKKFAHRILFFSIFSFFIYMLIYFVGIPITGIFYPTIIKDATPIFYLANLALIIFILGNTIQPTLLTYCKTKWHLTIQIVYLFIYIVTGYFGINKDGLTGFCIALLISNISRVVLMVLVILRTLYKNNNTANVAETIH